MTPRLRRLRGIPMLGGAASVAAITAIARLSGGVREMLIAGQFGTSRQLEAFLVAFGVLSLSIIGLSAAVPSSVVPVVHRRGVVDLDDLRSFRRSAVWPLLLALCGLAAAVALASPLIARVAGGGFGRHTQDVVRTSILILAPVIPIAGLGYFFASVINSTERFTTGALPLILNPLTTILVIVSSHRPTASLLSVAYLTGYTVETLALALLAARVTRRRSTGVEAGIEAGVGAAVEAPSDAAERLEDRRMFFGLLLPLTLGFTVQGANLVIDQSVASHLPQGDVAILAYGTRIPSFATAIAITAIGTVVLPTFSRLHARREVADLRRLLHRTLLVLMVITIPIATVLSVWSRPILEVVFGRGAFTADDVAAAAIVQTVAAWTLPIGLLAVVFQRLQSAARKRRVVLLVSLATATVNLVADVALARWIGVVGIVWSTVATLAFNASVYAALSRSDLRVVPASAATLDA